MSIDFIEHHATIKNSSALRKRSHLTNIHINELFYYFNTYTHTLNVVLSGF